MDYSRIIDLLKHYDINCKFIPYEDMHNISSVEELMPCSLILYQLSGALGMGHFCCIFRNSTNGITSRSEPEHEHSTPMYGSLSKL